MLNRVGVLILVLGFGAAISVWLAQDRIDRRVAAGRTNDLSSNAIVQPLAPDDSRRYTHDVEMYYGKTGLLMDKWTRWFKTITHGKPLAWTIALTAIIAAAGLFLFAAIYRPAPIVCFLTRC